MPQQVKNLRSNSKTGLVPKAPEASQLEYGEIAINYAKDLETIFIKNSNDEVVGFPRRPDTVQVSGTSTTDIMSQDAVTKTIQAHETAADAKYLTQSAASETYLNKTDASNTYLTQSAASDTYLTQEDASDTYLTQSAASDTYLTQSAASNTYITKTEATGDFLTKTDAASTYLTQTNAGSTYVAKADIADNLTTQDASKVLSANQGYDIAQRLAAVEAELAGVNALADKLLVDSL